LTEQGGHDATLLGCTLAEHSSRVPYSIALINNPASAASQVEFNGNQAAARRITLASSPLPVAPRDVDSVWLDARRRHGACL